MKEFTFLISKNNNFFAEIFNKVLNQMEYHLSFVKEDKVLDFLTIKNLKYLLVDMTFSNNKEILSKIKLHFPFLPIILISPVIYEPFIVELADKKNIYFIEINESFLEDLKEVIKRIEEKQTKATIENLNPYNFIGVSEPIVKIKQKIEKLAYIDAPILLTGESGTGKQIAAHLIHDLSRKGKPFIELNCASFSQTLTESELFGYEKGAFTGANSSYSGKLDLVGEGTLVLDEIGEMDIALQAKLLNVLEGREYYPLGSNTPKYFKGRIIACTNKNLLEELKNKEFRGDLFYRLSHFSLTMPSLKERQADIPLLINYYFEHYSTKYNKKNLKFEKSAKKILEDYSFPGNIRELEAVIQRLIIYTTNHSSITNDCVIDAINDIKIIQTPLDIKQKIEFNEEVFLRNDFVENENVVLTKKSVIPLKKAMELQEKKYLAYIINQGVFRSMAEMAQMLCIERSSLYRKTHYHKI